jgi:hypothetical protein
MTTYTDLLLLTMVAVVLLLVSNFSSSVPPTAAITSLLEELFLRSHYFLPIFADHGQEVSIMLDSAQFVPLTTGKGNQVNVFLNYKVNDPSIINSQINSVMKVYWPNRTLFKTSSSPEGFILNETGTQRHTTTITNSKLVDPTAVVQFTNLAKTVPISNPVQIRLNLDQPSATTSTPTRGQGARCAQSQNDSNVWYLAATFGGKAERTCTIPSGKALFFTVIGIACNAKQDMVKTEAEFRECVREVMDYLRLATAQLDGVNIPECRTISSNLFNIPGRPSERCFMESTAWTY